VRLLTGRDPDASLAASWRTLAVAGLAMLGLICVVALVAGSTANAAVIKKVKLKAPKSTTKPPTVTVTGSGFESEPRGYPTKECGDGEVFGLKAEEHFWFNDISSGWNAGMGTSAEPGSCVGLIVKKWTSTKVVFTFGSEYGSAGWYVEDGEEFQVAVAGAIWTGHAT